MEKEESPPGESPTFSCEAIDPSELKILAVSATDGMIDYLNPVDIGYVFAASFFVEDNPHPHIAAEHLILHAADQWYEEYKGQYRDDIAVSAIKVFSDDSIIAEGSKK